jgi:hypothetical protein
LTGVDFSMPQFLDKFLGRIANFAGIKFTNSDLMAFPLRLRSHTGRLDNLRGGDEYLVVASSLLPSSIIHTS